jgi:ketosteroid isomerase-like protein
MRDCSDLAGHLFDLASAGHIDQLLPCLHPDVEVVIDGETLSYQDMEALAAEAMKTGITRATAHTTHAVDATRIAIEGRMRAPNRRGRGFSDRPVAWALVFRDGLLFRSWREPNLASAIARLEAETIGAGSSI